MIDAPASTRSVPEWRGSRIVKAGSSSVPARVNPTCEIALNDFGLEESYGRFGEWNTRYGRKSPPCGVLVDLFV